MKVRYLAEGFFKNPEQARAAREKEKEMSNGEAIAALSSTLIAKQIEEKLNEYVTCFSEEIGAWWNDNEMQKAGRYLCNHTRVTVGYFIPEYNRGSASVVHHDNASIKFKATAKGDDIIYDIYVLPDKRQQDVFFSSVKTEIRIESGPIKSYQIDKRIFNDDCIRWITKAAEFDIQNNDSAKSQASSYILDKIQNEHFNINKIHLFEGSKADYYYLLDYNKTMAKEVLSAQVYMYGLQRVKDLLSFDNDGKNVVVATERQGQKEKILLSLDSVSNITGDNSIYDVFFGFIDHISDYNNVAKGYCSNPKGREYWYNNELAPYAKQFPEKVKEDPSCLKNIRFTVSILPTKYVFDITSDIPKQIETFPHIMQVAFTVTSVEGKYFDKPFSSQTMTELDGERLVTFHESYDTDYDTQTSTIVYAGIFDMFILGLYLKRGLTYGSSKLTDDEREKIRDVWKSAKREGVDSYTTTSIPMNSDIVKNLNNVIKAIRKEYSVMPKKLAKPLWTNKI